MAAPTAASGAVLGEVDGPATSARAPTLEAATSPSGMLPQSRTEATLFGVPAVGDLEQGAEDPAVRSPARGSRQPAQEAMWGASVAVWRSPVHQSGSGESLPRVADLQRRSLSELARDVLLRFQIFMRGPTAQQEAGFALRFKVLALLVLTFSIGWVMNYIVMVMPQIEVQGESLCKYNDDQLTYSAKMLFVYFLWFSIARLSLFLPCVAARVAQVQSRTHGFCRTYAIHLVVRDGPLYIFVVGSVLFGFHVMQSQGCDERNLDLYTTLKIHAVCSVLLSALCLCLAYWHNRLLPGAQQDVPESEEPGMPPDFLETLDRKSVV